MKLGEIVLRIVRLPLIRPYRLSYRTFTEFEPIIVEARSTDGRIGWGEGHISPGSSSETREGGWSFAREQAANIVGKDTRDAKAILASAMPASKVAATALLTAIEMLEDHSALRPDKETRLPLLAPINSTDEQDIGQEIARLLSEGFRTFKIKVGNDVQADLNRVRAIQRCVNRSASLRIDANRGYDRADACRFAAELDAEGVELFEQPCPTEDWDANAEVARVSKVPVMLDEPICATGDIDRAATLEGVGFCKLKLKRFGGLDFLRDALMLVRARGMQPVLGDGLATEIGCWMEACVARITITNAGEFNGFLKPKVRLFAEPLVFEAGSLVLPANFTPSIDRAMLKTHEITAERFAPRMVGAMGGAAEG